VNRREWWQKPQLRTDEEEKKHRSVTWLELFFDLVFVVVIARLSHNLVGDVTAGGLFTFLFLFVPVWWIWNGVTYYNERFESEGVEMRLFTFLTMIPVAGLAVFSHHGLTDNYHGFAACYLLARSVNIFMWVRGGLHEPVFRPSTNRFAAGFVVAVVLILLSMTVPSPLRLVLWGAALLVEVAAPWFTVGHQAAMPKLSTSKLPERFGLLTIIVLGEAIVGAISGVAEEHHFTAATAAGSVLGLAIGFALWWVYFDFVARRPFRHTRYAMFFWPYLHMPLTAAITAAGAGILVCLKSGDHGLGDPERLLVTAAVGTALISVGLVEMTLVRLEDEPTHPSLSPALKIGGGGLMILSGLAMSGLGTIPVFLMILFFLSAQIVYGVAAWFRQELES
jgi:low temperature requirement protein LtrA